MILKKKKSLRQGKRRKEMIVNGIKHVGLYRRLELFPSYYLVESFDNEQVDEAVDSAEVVVEAVALEGVVVVGVVLAEEEEEASAEVRKIEL